MPRLAEIRPENQLISCCEQQEEGRDEEKGPTAAEQTIN
jgi:hypothetical protein